MLDRYELYMYKQWLRVYMRSKMIKHNKDLFESHRRPVRAAREAPHLLAARHLGEPPALGWDPRAPAGVADRPFGDAGHPVLVMVGPVRKHERVGEQSAFVCHWVYERPFSASRFSVGFSMRPPNGSHAARAPCQDVRGPLRRAGREKRPQSGVESRTSRAILPPNGRGIGLPLSALVITKHPRRWQAPSHLTHSV